MKINNKDLMISNGTGAASPNFSSRSSALLFSGSNLVPALDHCK